MGKETTSDLCCQWITSKNSGVFMLPQVINTKGRHQTFFTEAIHRLVRGERLSVPELFEPPVSTEIQN